MGLNKWRLVWGTQRAINCYITLTIWILIIIAGIYKFLEPPQTVADSTPIADHFERLESDVRIFHACNQPHEIRPGDEGMLTMNGEQWYIKGILVVLRHGDRGPLQHIRNISMVNCGTPETDLLSAYKTFIHNATVSGKLTAWLGPGSFHGFPLLPPDPYRCHLGQLTMQGVSQLLTLGNVLRLSYVNRWPKLKNLTLHDVNVYSTRYHRTFQSALAFLFAFIPAEIWHRLNFIESQSMTFCFKDCGCPVTEKYSRKLAKIATENLRTHPAIKALAESTANLIFTPEAEHGQDPQSVRDALLAYICHDSALPCDVPSKCIGRQNILGIFMYHEWTMSRLWKNVNYQRMCLLRSYGLVKHVVSHMLQMISNNGPSVVLYSGHDYTLLQLASALGLQHDAHFAKYGGRLVFEIYANSVESQTTHGAYFRLLANGRDVTRQVSFCKSLRNVHERVQLCKIEDIIRFIHDDYFSHFNVTNLKDACYVKLPT